MFPGLYAQTFAFQYVQSKQRGKSGARQVRKMIFHEEVFMNWKGLLTIPLDELERKIPLQGIHEKIIECQMTRLVMN